MLVSYVELGSRIVETEVLEGVASADQINGTSIDITLGPDLLIEDTPVPKCPHCGEQRITLSYSDLSRENRQELLYCMFCMKHSYSCEWIAPVDFGAKEPLAMRKVSCKDGYVLYPGEVCLAHSVERFNLPMDITAEYRLKSSMARVFLEHLHAGWCFVGETEIALLDGSSVPIKDLVGKEVWVYSLDDKGEVIPGHATNIRKTREVNDLVCVSLDSGDNFTCTPDHRIMLRDGVYKEAQYLRTDDALMPLYRREGQHGHEEVYCPSTVLKGAWKTLKGKWNKTHKIVYTYLHGELPKGKAIHHKDHTKYNNSPDNLVSMDAVEHSAMHNSQRNKTLAARKAASLRASARNRRMWSDPSKRKEWTERNSDNAKSTNEKRWGYFNHKVVSVRKFRSRNRVPVYDLTVEGPHNFALSSGVFVHNCDPGWHGSVLTLEFVNMTQHHPLKLTAGMKCGQVCFYKHEPVPKDRSYAVRGKYNNSETVTPSQGST